MRDRSSIPLVCRAIDVTKMDTRRGLFARWSYRSFLDSLQKNVWLIPAAKSFIFSFHPTRAIVLIHFWLSEMRFPCGHAFSSRDELIFAGQFETHLLNCTFSLWHHFCRYVVIRVSAIENHRRKIERVISMRSRRR